MARSPSHLAMLLVGKPKADAGNVDYDGDADLDDATKGVIDALESKDPDAVKSALCDFIDAHLAAKDSDDGAEPDKG